LRLNQISMNIAVTAAAAALKPKLFDLRKQPFILPLARTFRLFQPGVIAAGMNAQRTA